jgi:hypothetical protein
MKWSFSCVQLRERGQLLSFELHLQNQMNGYTFVFVKCTSKLDVRLSERRVSKLNEWLGFETLS